MGNPDDRILCIKSKTLFKEGKWNGLKKDNLKYYYSFLIKESEFKRRGDLEEDPSYKQIIPQVILRYDNKYFVHRQVAAGEKRLNGLCPLPLGGHVEEFDLNHEEDLLQTCLNRELHEEAEVKANIINKEFMGLIYIEGENPVNYVHMGLFYIFDLDGNDVKMREEGLETIGWVDKKYLEEHINELTYWSRVFIKEGLPNENMEGKESVKRENN